MIANTITNNDNAVMHTLYINSATINPIEKFILLHEQKNALYERVLEEEEIMERLERLISKKQICVKRKKNYLIRIYW